eukprot:111734-Ditylum_brightwellii.AAC.1
MAKKLDLLTKLCSKKVNWQWAEEELKASEVINVTLAKDTLLLYPYFNMKFEIYTDASKCTTMEVVPTKYPCPCYILIWSSRSLTGNTCCIPGVHAITPPHILGCARTFSKNSLSWRVTTRTSLKAGPSCGAD